MKPKNPILFRLLSLSIHCWLKHIDTPDEVAVHVDRTERIAQLYRYLATN